jgi:uncharacterized lipoprotein YbaY
MGRKHPQKRFAMTAFTDELEPVRISVRVEDSGTLVWITGAEQPVLIDNGQVAEITVYRAISTRVDLFKSEANE